MEIIPVVATDVVVETSKRVVRGRRVGRVVEVRCMGPQQQQVSSESVDANMAKRILSRRAARAVRQVVLGEISAGRQALEGEKKFFCTRDFENVEGFLRIPRDAPKAHENFWCQSCHITFYGHGLCWILNCVPLTCENFGGVQQAAIRNNS